MLRYAVVVVPRLTIGKTNEKKNKVLMVWTINMNKKNHKSRKKKHKIWLS